MSVPVGSIDREDRVDWCRCGGRVARMLLVGVQRVERCLAAPEAAVLPVTPHPIVVGTGGELRSRGLTVMSRLLCLAELHRHGVAGDVPAAERAGFEPADRGAVCGLATRCVRPLRHLSLCVRWRPAPDFNRIRPLCRRLLRVFGVRAMRAVDGFRSRDLDVGNVVLCHLSSYRVCTRDGCGSERRVRTSKPCG